MIKNLILRIKSRLPLNGDWIFVTENITASRNDDISDDFDNPEDIIDRLKSNTIEILEIAYKMSSDYYNSMLNRSDKVREKAKVIVNSSSFISAVIIAISSSIVVINKSPNYTWLLFIEFLLYLMTIIHLTRSLLLALTVIRREESIEISPIDIVKVAEYRNKKNLSKIYKDVSSKMIAYANNTHEFIRKRVNQLILSQTSYKYGLFYFVIFMVLHVVILNLNQSKDSSLTDLIELYKENQTLELEISEEQLLLIKNFLNRYDSIEHKKTEYLLEDSISSIHNDSVK